MNLARRETLARRMLGGALPAAMLASAIAALACAHAAAAAPAGHDRQRAIDQLVYPKLNPITMPAVVRETLPNGIRVLMVEDHELPKIALRAEIRGGALAEPPGRKGLSDLLGEVLRTGGTKTTGGDQVDEMLERIGASIEAGADVDSFSLNGDMLKEHVDKVLPLFAEFLIDPAFAQEKIDLALTQMKSAISRRNDQVMEVARREFLKLAYGADSPYARQLEYADLNVLTRADLVALHEKAFRPDQTIIAVWGDFDAKQMKQKLAAVLGRWTAQGPSPKYAVPAIPPASGSINFIEKSDVAQTFFLLGHQGLRLDDPDYAAVYVMELILGDGFSSRIFNKVRTEKGLAYSAGGYMIPAFDHPGMFYFMTSTKPESSTEALNTVLGEIRLIREEPVTDGELRRAKETYLNSYAFEFDSKAKIVNRLTTYEFYGYPADFNTRIRAAVEKVTKDDVLRVAKQRLFPEKLSILAIGVASKLDRPLTTIAGYGPLRSIDITIPEPQVAQGPAATPESLTRGKELLLKAARARGAALAGVKDITTQGSMTVQTPGGPMDLKVKSMFLLPDRQVNEIGTPMGTMVQGIDGAGAWMVFGGNRQDMPSSEADEQRASLPADAGALLLLQQALAGKVEGQALGIETFEGQPAEVVQVKIGGKPARLYLAPDSFLVVGLKRQGRTEQGPGELVTTFGKYVAVDGVQLPMQSSVSANGKPIATGTVESAKINGGVDPKLFEKPAAPAPAAEPRR